MLWWSAIWKLSSAVALINCNFLRSFNSRIGRVGWGNPCRFAVFRAHFKSRWGSCNVKGEIQFHWKVIMAPHRIVEYVAVHELCHLKHHDHSPAFWKSVERIVPDYAECRSWLKEFGSGLRFRSLVGLCRNQIEQGREYLFERLR